MLKAINLDNNKKMMKIFAVLFLISVTLSSPRYGFAKPVCKNAVAKVISAQGKVLVRIHGAEQWQAIAKDDQICPGDTLRTSKWSRATLIFNSKNIVTLDQSTTLNFPAPQGQTVSWLLKVFEGVSFFRSRLPQKLNVQTPFINAVHEGTEFIVAVTGAKAEISVLDGQVAAENGAGKINIKKGEKGVAEAGKAPKVRSITVSPQDAVQWSLYYPHVIDYSGSASGSKNPLLTQAISAYRQSDTDKAISLLEETPAILDNPQLLNLKAGFLLTVGRVDEAGPLIDRVQRLEPDNSDALALQAVIAVAHNRQQQALELANKSVKVKPDSVVAKIARSYAYQALFDIDNALKAAHEAARLAPDNGLAWARLAELQLSQGEHGAALASARKAQALNPDIARTQTVLGFADLAETDIGGATQAFQRAISLDSSDPLARLGLGLALIRRGDVEAGKNELETAVSLDPNNAVTRSYLGKAYYELRNKEYAGKEFEIAKTMDPKDPTPYFYDAILKQNINRPVEALHDMQKAIELNDNRGVYRSRLLLDKDTAARQVGLGRIFNNLGFDDPANRQAMKSLALDPSNYSAHRLLSDSDATRPRHEIARASEHLQSQLLQPLNYNPIQPSLAYTDLNIIRGTGPSEISFNEYNRLFERDGIRLSSTGIAGSNSTFGDETALSGIYDKFSFSLGQLHYDTNGFRDNNDLKHDIYNVFAQYEFSPEVNVQAEYRRRETEHGDLELRGDPNTFDSSYRRRIEQDTYRYGLKVSPSKRSDFLTSFIHAIRTESTLQGGGFADLSQKTYSYDVEMQHLFHGDAISTVTGGGMYRTENDLNFKFALPVPICPGGQSQCLSDFNTTQYFGYFYSYFKPLKDLTLTTGLSFDHYRDKHVGAQAKQNELNPKFGFIWQADEQLTLRGAVFKSVKSAIVDNQILQPTQVAGFNQFFDDLNGTAAWLYGLGADAKINQVLYLGAEAYKRDLRIPKDINIYERTREGLYRFYLNWTPLPAIAVNSEFRFENFRWESINSNQFYPSSVDTIFFPLAVRYFNQAGFFAEVKGTLVNQKVLSVDFASGRYGANNASSNFYLLDAAMGYRFPKQYGLISIEAKNLLDTSFYYRDRQFQLNEQRTADFFPERMIFGRITLNF